jgi:NAD+ synthase (glutamine-hydrolysing)
VCVLALRVVFPFSDALMGAQLAGLFDQIRLFFRSVSGFSLVLCSDSVPRTFIADVNPIGGISKADLKRFIAWAQEKFQLPILSR